MSQPWNKILGGVVALHLVCLNVVVVGFAVPKPVSQAVFFYRHDPYFDEAAVKVNDFHPKQAIDFFSPKAPLQEDEALKLLIKTGRDKYGVH